MHVALVIPILFIPVAANCEREFLTVRVPDQLHDGSMDLTVHGLYQSTHMTHIYVPIHVLSLSL
mgnify:CR=1 FL=1